MFRCPYVHNGIVEAKNRIIVIGDLHADYDKALKIFTDLEIEEMQQQINREAGIEPEDGGIAVPDGSDGITRYPSIDGAPIPADDVAKLSGNAPPEDDKEK